MLYTIIQENLDKQFNFMVTSGMKDIDRIKIENEDGTEPDIDLYEIRVDDMIYPAYYDFKIGYKQLDDKPIYVSGINKSDNNLKLCLYHKNE